MAPASGPGIGAQSSSRPSRVFAWPLLWFFAAVTRRRSGGPPLLDEGDALLAVDACLAEVPDLHVEGTTDALRRAYPRPYPSRNASASTVVPSSGSTS